MWFLITVAWRNLWRQRRRSLITASAMAIAVGLCMSVICLNDGTYGKFFDIMVEQQLGHVQVHNPEYPGKNQMYDTMTEAEKMLTDIDTIEDVRSVSARLKGFALVGGKDKSAGAQLVGILPEREKAVTAVATRIKEGVYLDQSPPGSIIIGIGMAEDLDISLGEEIVAVTQASDGSMGNALYKVTGIYKTGSAQMDKSGGFVHLADLQDLLALPDQIHQVTVLGKDKEMLTELSAAVSGAVGDDKLVQTWEEASPQTAQLLGMQDLAAFITLGIVFMVAGFGVVNTMMMSVFERTREFGVLRAIGLRPGRLIGMVVIEAMFLAALAGTIGLAIGGFLDWYLITYGLDLSADTPDGFEFSGVVFEPILYGAFRIEPVIATMASVVVVSMIASLLPAWRAARLNPVEAIRAE